METLNNDLVKIVDLLNKQEFIGIDTLAQHCGLSNALVQAHIEALKNYGLPITETKNSGYKLEKYYSLLDANKIEPQLSHKNIVLNIFETINSTNEYLKTLSQQKSIVVSLAETQTQGQGRLSREWYSPFAENIYCSLRISLQFNIADLSGFSLIIGLAICKAIEKVCYLSEKTYVKWPNDIFIDNKKLGGILVEALTDKQDNCIVIIGIGLNVNMNAVPQKKVSQPWAALTHFSNKPIDRNILVAEIINQILNYIEIFSTKGLSEFQKEWQQRDYLAEKTIALQANNQVHEGIARGIDKFGRLVLEKTDGSKPCFTSGEATLFKRLN